MSVKKIKFLSITLAILAELILMYIIYFNPHKIEPLYSTDLKMTVNASLNAVSALALFIAFRFIQKQDIKKHIIFIHVAMFFSAAFLVNYIFYHLSVGHVRFEHTYLRAPYIILLITHLLASFVALPMIFYTYLLGIFQKRKQHKSIAKKTFYIWEYVSITGVMIVLMIKMFHGQG